MASLGQITMWSLEGVLESSCNRGEVNSSQAMRSDYTLTTHCAVLLILSISSQ